MNCADFLKRQVVVFRDFPVSRLQRLVEGSRAPTFEAGDLMARQGEE